MLEICHAKRKGDAVVEYVFIFSLMALACLSGLSSDETAQNGYSDQIVAPVTATPPVRKD